MSQEHYKFKNGAQCPLTKKEIYETINVYNYNTVLKWCEYFDIPFIEYYWDQCRKIVEQRGQKPISKFVFGKYYACMRLCSFKNFTYNDTKKLRHIWK